MRRMGFVLLVTIIASACSTTGSDATHDGVSRLRAAPAGNGCAFSAGTGSDTVVIGTVALDKDHVEKRGLLLSGGRIREIGDGDALAREHSDANVIRCDGVLISPGFINSHEHTAFSFLFPDPQMSPLYVHRDEWRLGLNAKPKLSYHDTKDPAILAWIEIRHLIHGETTVAGSGGVEGIVKNASSPASPVYVYVDDMQTFPFGLDVDKNFGNASCDSDASQLGTPRMTQGTATTVPYVPHVGEGTNCAAKLELDEYLSYVASNPGRKYSLIHGLALQKSHLAALKDNAVSVIWSPRSNLALYGRTLDPTWLMDAGVSVALGTDWSLSGSYNILDEMACAKSVSQQKSLRPLTGGEIWQMATTEGAIALGIENSTGSIAVGKEADLVIIGDPSGAGVNLLGTAGRPDIIAVFIDGELMSGHLNKFANRPASRCSYEIEGNFLCIDFSKYTFTFDEMKARNAGNVDLVDVGKQAECKF